MPRVECIILKVVIMMKYNTRDTYLYHGLFTILWTGAFVAVLIFFQYRKRISSDYYKYETGATPIAVGALTLTILY